MSYCRFENTSRDLCDCVDALENNEIDVDSSMREIDGLASILGYALQIVEMQDDIKNIIDNANSDDDEISILQ
jgi:hypothetical protein